MLYVSKEMKAFKVSVVHLFNALSSSYLVIKQMQKRKDKSPYSHAVQATLIN